MNTVPEMMQAIDPEQAGGPEVLKVVQRPVPRPQEGEVLIKVEAAGVNRPDVMQRMGLYPPPPGAPTIPGLEVAGRIVAVGAGVGSVAEGWGGTAVGSAGRAVLAGSSDEEPPEMGLRSGAALAHPITPTAASTRVAATLRLGMSSSSARGRDLPACA